MKDIEIAILRVIVWACTSLIDKMTGDKLI